MKLSEKYIEKTVKTVGTETYSLTDTISNLFPYNQVVNDFSFTATRPINDIKVFGLLRSPAYTQKPNSENVMTVGGKKVFGVSSNRINPTETTKRYIAYTFKLSNNDFRVSVNKNLDVTANYGGTTVSANYSQVAFVRDIDYRKFLITVIPRGFTKQEFITALTDNSIPTEHNISLEDLYNNPDNYYITDLNTSSRLWGGSGWQNASNIGITPVCIDVGANTLSIKSFNSAYTIPYETYTLTSTTIPETITSSGIQPYVYTNVNRSASVYNFGVNHEIQINNDITQFPTYQNTAEHIWYTEQAQSETGFLKYRVYTYKYNSATVLNNVSCKQYVYLTGKKALEFISTLGCYLCDTSSALTSTPETLENDTHIWLCEQDENGFTTGKLLRGQDIKKSKSPNKDGSTNSDTFNPNKNSSSDRIDDVTLRNYSFGSSYIKYYAMSESELLNFVTALQNENIPPENILGVMYSPYDLTVHENELQPITYQGKKIGDGITATRILNLLHTFDLGDTPITGNNNNYLDYAPYTDISVYVPHCTNVQLPTNLFMNENLKCELISDITTGACKGVISVNNTIYTTVNGTILTSYPLAVTDMNQLYSAVLSGGLGTISGISGIAAGNYLGGMLTAAGAISQTAVALNSITPKQISSCGTGAINYNMPNTPVLYMSCPDVIASEYNKVAGYACDKTVKVNQISGYTVCDSVRLDNCNATIEIQDLIISKLKSGFIAW